MEIEIHRLVEYPRKTRDLLESELKKKKEVPHIMGKEEI
jgi:hypothetical protein